VYIGFWWENLRERDHFEDLGIDGKIINFVVFMNVYCNNYFVETTTHAHTYC